MSEIDNNISSVSGGHRKKRARKHSTHIDMTPMVDLMSLLITFFMLTTAFSKAKIMEIVLPQDGGSNDSIEIPADRTLNLLLSENNKVYYYIGKPPVSDNEVLASVGRLQKLDYGKDGIRSTVLKMNLLLYEKVDSASQLVITGKTRISQDSLLSLIRIYKKKDKKGPIVMIKADKKAKYRNIVDVIDEMEICNVARYAIVDPSEFELKLIENASH